MLNVRITINTGMPLAYGDLTTRDIDFPTLFASLKLKAINPLTPVVSKSYLVSPYKLMRIYMGDLIVGVILQNIDGLCFI